jgi:hypothetical protein
MPLAEALALVKRRRPKADPLPAFLEMLKGYEQTCRSIGAISADEDTKVKRVIGPQLGPRMDAAPMESIPSKRARVVGPPVGPPTNAPPKESPEKRARIVGPPVGPQMDAPKETTASLSRRSATNDITE